MTIDSQYNIWCVISYMQGDLLAYKTYISYKQVHLFGCKTYISYKQDYLLA